MNPMHRSIPLVLIACLWVARSLVAGPAEDRFEREIRPIFVEHCQKCHGQSKQMAGLRLDSRKAALVGGENGPVLLPGKPADSRLVQMLKPAAEKRMPPKVPLTDKQIGLIEDWVRAGAAWPESASATRGPAKREDLWSFKPLASPATKSGIPSAIDGFISDRLQKEGMHFAPPASRRELLRRASYVLTGLPPTLEQVEAFEKNTAPNAWEKEIDRLLASPALGERWARHWMDVARYSDTKGYVFFQDGSFPWAYAYRDWLIQSFNSDLPYDRFVRSQIAADRLVAKNEAQISDLPALGFLSLGGRFMNNQHDIIDDRIDVVTRGLLGLTVACSRCHDHKFDPVPATDYYALAGILTSTEQCAGVRNKMGGAGLDYYDASMLVVLAPADEGTAAKIAIAKAEVEAAKAAFEQIRGTPEGLAKGENGRPIQQGYRQRWMRAQQEFERLSDPARTGKVAMGLRDAEKIGDTEIRVRGEAEQLGPVVPRGFPSAVEVPGAEPIDPAASGRLQLARWLAHPHNPLTARVYVNRVWQRLFGTGLVDTVDNFGVTGNAPSHPELLDRLAADFVADGWSTKRLVRRLVLSRTYGLSASSQERALAVDPANRLLWRHSPRRLDAEEIRDTMLAIAGRLDRSRPAEGPSRQLEVRELRNNGREIATILSFAKASVQRSVYLPLLRTVVPGALEAFDFADQGQVTGQRESTTVPAQALYLLNDPFVAKQSLVVAETLLDRPTGDDRERIASAFRLVLGRLPTSPEIDDVLAFLAAFEAQAPATPAPVAETPVEAVVTAPSAPDPNLDPDQVEQDSEKVVEELALPRDTRSAAFAAFVQAMLASAEFRYVP